MANAEVCTIKSSQKEYFKQKHEALQIGNSGSAISKLARLTIELDIDRLIRWNGQLMHVEFLPYDTRFPEILSRDSLVIRLIVRSYHKENNHSAVTNLLAMQSRRFSVVSGRDIIKECPNHCMICKKNKAAPVLHLMAPLPQIRLELNIMAVSNVGAFLTIHYRGKTWNKRYLSLFTCSRAVYLEMTFSLDTAAILNWFYRMVIIRGVPMDVITGNGGCFVAANN